MYPRCQGTGGRDAGSKAARVPECQGAMAGKGHLGGKNSAIMPLFLHWLLMWGLLVTFYETANRGRHLFWKI